MTTTTHDTALLTALLTIKYNHYNITKDFSQSPVTQSKWHLQQNKWNTITYKKYKHVKSLSTEIYYPFSSKVTLILFNGSNDNA